MSTFNYAKMQTTATRLLTRFNQGTVTLSRSVPGDPPDPEEPFVLGAPVTTVYTLKAAVKAVGKQFIDGTTILATDLEISCAAFAIEPAPGDVISIDGTAVTTIKTMRIPAAGTVVAHKFIVRG